LLEFNNERYLKSLTSFRCVARDLHLTGISGLDQLKCDIIAETVQEIDEGFFQA
jgi:hypothetical protein